MKPHYLIDQETTHPEKRETKFLERLKSAPDYEERKQKAYEKRKEFSNDYEAKKAAKNKLMHEQLYALHEKLVQTCIDFINENNLGDIEEIGFNVDSLQMSAEYGSWQPCTDSSLVAYEEVPDENYYYTRKEIDYSM